MGQFGTKPQDKTADWINQWHTTRNYSCGSYMQKPSGPHEYPEKYETVADEKTFWVNWYRITNDYSVGPDMKVYGDEFDRGFQTRHHSEVLRKYKQQDGSFRLPRGYFDM